MSNILFALKAGLNCTRYKQTILNKYDMALMTNIDYNLQIPIIQSVLK